MRLESKSLVEQNRIESLHSYTSTISHEFRTPLGNCLMFLEGLLECNLEPVIIRTLNLIISQLNMLLCLVNDVLDIKQIEQGVFEKKVQEFSPKSTLEWIAAMFKPQAAMVNTRIDTEVVAFDKSD